MSAEDCIKAIGEALGKNKKLTDEEIRFVADELRNRFRKRAGSASADNVWATVAKGLVDDIKEAAAIERRNAALNVTAKEKLLAMAHEANAKYGRPDQGIEATMVGIMRPLKGNRRSVDYDAFGIAAEYFRPIIAQMDREGLTAHFNDGHLDLEVARALEKITKDDAPGSQNAEANRIARIIYDERAKLLDRQNRAGSWVKELAGYITRQNHDQTKVFKAGFETWRDFIKPLLDEERTFGNTDLKVDDFLREAWSTIKNGEVLRQTGADLDLNLAFKGPGNLGKRISHHRVLHFKDADAWTQYNEKFGRGSLREAILMDFMNMARNTALMEHFGPNPIAMFENVIDLLKKEFRDDDKKLKELEGGFVPLRAYMNTITGHTDVPVNPQWGERWRAVRSLTDLAKLGLSVVSSLSDIAAKAAQIRYMDGGGVLSPVLQSFTTFFEGMPTRDRKEVADRILAALDGMRGGIAQRFGALDAPSGTMAGWLQNFFKLNLLTPWTEINKRGLAFLAARSLAKYANKGFDSLPDHMRSILESHSIDSGMWDVVRTLKEDYEGRSHIFPDLLDRRTDLPVEEREAIGTALQSFFIDITESGVPTPGAKERTMLTRGFRPATWEGEAFRFISQFKSFPLTVGTKVYGRLAYSNPDGRKDIVGMAMFLAQSTILGYASMVMKQIIKGQVPTYPTDYQSSLGVVSQALLQGGGLGIYGDFIVGQTNRYGHSLIESLAGPNVGTMADIIELKDKIMSGDAPTANALRLAMNNTPFINLFYTRTAFDYLFLYQLQEMANPGYLRRHEHQVLKDQQARYIVPPSSVIPYGGGNKIFEGIR